MGGCGGWMRWADAGGGCGGNLAGRMRYVDLIRILTRPPAMGVVGGTPKLSPHIWSYFCGPYRGSPPKSGLGENPSGDRVALGCALGGSLKGRTRWVAQYILSHPSFIPNILIASSHRLYPAGAWGCPPDNLSY